MKMIIRILQGLIAQKFWGELVFQFANGKIVCVKKNEVIKEDLDILNEPCI
jgi:hypothetical protein